MELKITVDHNHIVWRYLIHIDGRQVGTIEEIAFQDQPTFIVLDNNDNQISDDFTSPLDVANHVKMNYTRMFK